jgi:hypothetical protein
MNRVYLCGAEPGMNSDSIRHIIDLFAAEGIERFFVWLSPAPDEAMRGWLGGNGLTRVQWTGYPTLCRSVWSPVPFGTDLRCTKSARMKSPQCANLRIGPSGPTMCGRPAAKAFHYMAFDGKRPVAIAALCIFEDIGYLMAAATAESHRRRGAQRR